MADISKCEVGDKVVTDRDHIGTIIRITPTGRIVVSFGNYEARYGKDGWELGKGSVFYKSRIVPLTAEKEKQLEEQAMVRKCISLFEKKEKQLTSDKAKKIIEILSL